MTVVNWGGQSHTIPDNRNPKGWGPGATAFLLALAAKAIPTTGGTQTLSAELNFGNAHGVVAPYFKSSSSNISATGVIRFANNEGLGFRNAANSADIILKVNASNALDFGGAVIPTVGSKLSAFAATTSAELATVISDETGSGVLVFSNSPTLVTPVLGAATATSLNKLAITAPATGSTLTVADGKTLTASNTLTFTGTDGSSVAFGAGGTAAYTGNKLSVFAATSSAELAGVISDETGSGVLVFGTSPTIATPTISGASTLNNVSTPSNPSAGNIKFYSKSDKPTYLDSSGNERVVANTADSLSNPMTTSGDIIYGGASGSATRLAGNTTTTRKVLAQTGDGTNSAAPAWTEPMATGALSGWTKPRKGQYNLTVSGTSSWTTTKATAIYYQDQDGNHRVKLNIAGFTSVSIASVTLTVTDLVFHSAISQVLAGAGSGTSTGSPTGAVGMCTLNASTIAVRAYDGGSTSRQYWWLAGDVELASKPTWA